MCVDFDFPISLRMDYSVSPSVLMQRFKSWLKTKNTTHLIHPLGFWIVLLKRSDTEEWRFHFWPPGEANVQGMPATIHTHDREVESRVVLGTITNTLYREMDTAQAKLPVYEVCYGGDRFVQGTANLLRNTGRLTAVSPTAERVLKVGDRYRVAAHTLHQVVAERSVAAATIVRTHSSIPGTAKVIGLPGFPNRMMFQRSSGSSADLLRKLP